MLQHVVVTSVCAGDRMALGLHDLAVSFDVHLANYLSCVCTARIGDSVEMAVQDSDQAEDSDVATATDGAETGTVATVEQSGAGSTEPEQKSTLQPQGGSTLTEGRCVHIILYM